ncbi:hypothetical protein DPMN_094465 [Dreissena polymorpha]|uniref:Uncharacterized protein n=1 Tax=Dreissena polymorpha TaxID=45954 RepID=A0A9D4L5J5_DREPO|nr:hypothetical protein DPMN_094465 [Dreissena polymorpha]
MRVLLQIERCNRAIFQIIAGCLGLMIGLWLSTDRVKWRMLYSRQASHTLYKRCTLKGGVQATQNTVIVVNGHTLSTANTEHCDSIEWSHLEYSQHRKL